MAGTAKQVDYRERLIQAPRVLLCRFASIPVGDAMDQEAFTTIWKGLAHVAAGRKTSAQLLEEAKKLVR